MGTFDSTELRQLGAGRQIGFERAQLDRMEGRVVAPDSLTIPPTASPAFARGCREAYAEAMAGQPVSLDL